MLRRTIDLLMPKKGPRHVARDVDPEAAKTLHSRIALIDSDPYLVHVENRLISVFDDTRFDRADMDVLSAGMRTHAVRKLEPLGFKQVTGSIIEHGDTGVRVLMPKFHTQGTSPFDAVRYVDRGPDDYVLLTPTQAAAQIIDAHPLDTAIKRLERLIVKHPINLLRLVDYLEKRPRHEEFRKAYGTLKRIQQDAVAGDALLRRRPL